MTTVQDEVAALAGALPADQARSLLDYARYLAEQSAEQGWDRAIAAAGTSASFRAEIADVRREIAEGKAAPLRVEDL